MSRNETVARVVVVITILLTIGFFAYLVTDDVRPIYALPLSCGFFFFSLFAVSWVAGVVLGWLVKR